MPWKMSKVPRESRHFLASWIIITPWPPENKRSLVDWSRAMSKALRGARCKPSAFWKRGPWRWLKRNNTQKCVRRQRTFPSLEALDLIIAVEISMSILQPFGSRGTNCHCHSSSDKFSAGDNCHHGDEAIAASRSCRRCPGRCLDRQGLFLKPTKI